MSTVKPNRKYGPYLVKFYGLQACLKSTKSSHNLKTMIVSHAFVDLWRMIEEDKSFDKQLFDQLDEQERGFMRHCLSRCKITSREFESAYNKTINHLVDRLKMLQDATQIGDDNPSIPGEMKTLLDKLYQKGVFSMAYYNQLRRLMKLN